MINLYDEKKLPETLIFYIDEYKKAKKENSSLLDCYWCELYGEINSQLWDFKITNEVAEYLRAKYLY
ncbi:hypothetical protein [Parvimonas parva]|uniref:Uncharacterized protein n=1 Tax=Parvimonas parva TaxID=2769485 RepID=A0ABS1C9T1_9FIRM|nr:hypothetical protein [Parvimonas parva]MBK1468826.1 hypothetical protein [Parvimonas parva]